jgi:hypothetical protein
MTIKIVLIVSTLIMAGCVVFPNVTTMSATTKATKDAIPTVKLQQTFKWSKKP